MTGILERLIYASIFLLPLVCWPGLEQPFSTPKIWLLAVTDLLVAVQYVLCGWKRPVARETIDWAWLAWLAALALSALTAAWVSMEALLLALLPAPLCWSLGRGWISADRVKQALLAGSVVESAIVVLQFSGFDLLQWIGWQPEVFAGTRMRVYGTLGNPNFVAAWSCATLPLFAGVVANRRTGKPLAAFACWVALTLQLAAILATGSRVFLLALPAAAAIMALRRARTWKWCLAGLPVAAALLWLSPARPLAVTVQGRLYLARVAASHWRDIPLFGFGPGSLRVQFAQWQVDWLRAHSAGEGLRQFAGDIDHVHNDYIELLVEYGPAGSCALLVLCGWLMGKAWRSRPGGTALDAGVWGGVASLLAIACVDFPLHRPAEWGLYWLLLGVLVQPNEDNKEDSK